MEDAQHWSISWRWVNTKEKFDYSNIVSKPCWTHVKNYQWFSLKETIPRMTRHDVTVAINIQVKAYLLVSYFASLM